MTDLHTAIVNLRTALPHGHGDDGTFTGRPFAATAAIAIGTPAAAKKKAANALANAGVLWSVATVELAAAYGFYGTLTVTGAPIDAKAPYDNLADCYGRFGSITTALITAYNTDGVTSPDAAHDTTALRILTEAAGILLQAVADAVDPDESKRIASLRESYTAELAILEEITTPAPRLEFGPDGRPVLLTWNGGGWNVSALVEGAYLTTGHTTPEEAVQALSAARRAACPECGSTEADGTLERLQDGNDTAYRCLAPDCQWGGIAGQDHIGTAP